LNVRLPSPDTHSPAFHQFCAWTFFFVFLFIYVAIFLRCAVYVPRTVLQTVLTPLPLPLRGFTATFAVYVERYGPSSLPAFAFAYNVPCGFTMQVVSPRRACRIFACTNAGAHHTACRAGVALDIASARSTPTYGWCRTTRSFRAPVRLRTGLFALPTPTCGTVTRVPHLFFATPLRLVAVDRFVDIAGFYRVRHQRTLLLHLNAVGFVSPFTLPWVCFAFALLRTLHSTNLPFGLCRFT